MSGLLDNLTQQGKTATPGLLDHLAPFASPSPDSPMGPFNPQNWPGYLGFGGQRQPSQRVADAFAQLPPEVMRTLTPPGLAQLLLGMMSPQGQQMPPSQGPGFGGLLTPGNIDVGNRPVVNNPDGTISTLRSMSANMDGRETLLPTVSPDGRMMSNEQAIDMYRRGGRHLGQYATPDDATRFAEMLHNGQAALYGRGR